MKTIRYAVETLLLRLCFLIFGTLPLDTASALGGWIGRSLGPRLAASRKAQRNLERALPGLSEVEKRRIIRQMWGNLGRVLAEYPHLEKIGRERITVRGEEIVRDALARNEGMMLVSAHLANWEIFAPAMLARHGAALDLTYRAPNNPGADKILQRARTLGGRVRAYPKSRSGGRALIEAVRAGRNIGMLIDQKYNEGVEAPFFGLPAMTNPVFVQLCQKYRKPVIPVRNRRLDGARFEITVYPPLQLFDAEDKPLPIATVIAAVHALLEDWIRDDPGQWLWLHKRWR